MAMETNKYRSMLSSKKEELARLAEIDQEGRRPVALDQSKVGRLSRMDALQSQAMSLEIERRRNQELARIEAALKRLDTDEFGFCLKCGDEIAEKRLMLDPTAATCIGCAGQNG